MTGQAVTMPAAIGRAEEDSSARLGVLFDTHHQRLFRLARRLARNEDDACDLVQDTFLRAAQHHQSVPAGHTSQEAWLVRVLVNIYRDRWRWSAVRVRALEERAIEAQFSRSPESSIVARATVQHALNLLSPKRRAILVLYELDGLAVKEIAAMLRMSAVTVRWHLSLGRREMARVLDGRRGS